MYETETEPETKGATRRTRAFATALFGLAGYLVGVQGVLYLMGYLTFGRELSGTSRAAAPRAAVFDLLLMLAFATHHSVLARTPVKRLLWHRLPEPVERSAYVGASGLLLILLTEHWQGLPFTLWNLSDTPWAFGVWLLYGLGWSLSLAAVFTLNQFDLFGLLGSLTELRRRPPRQAHLRENGPYRWLRHPMYTGFVIACWAAPEMSGGRLIFAASLTLYAIGGAWLEERDLALRYGEPYRQYRARVPAVLPARTRRAG